MREGQLLNLTLNNNKTFSYMQRMYYNLKMINPKKNLGLSKKYNKLKISNLRKNKISRDRI